MMYLYVYIEDCNVLKRRVASLCEDMESGNGMAITHKKNGGRLFFYLYADTWS